MQAVDSAGRVLKPLDLVVINQVPKYYCSDSDGEWFSRFSGSYGLITYSRGSDGAYEAFYSGDKTHPGWVSNSGRAVNVLARRLEADVTAAWEFWVPPEDVTRIPFNFLIMSLFTDYPWQMRDVDGPGVSHFMRAGFPEYDLLKRIVSSPYSVLVDAHRAAMEVLDRESPN